MHAASPVKKLAHHVQPDCLLHNWQFEFALQFDSAAQVADGTRTLGELHELVPFK